MSAIHFLVYNSFHETVSVNKKTKGKKVTMK